MTKAIKKGYEFCVKKFDPKDRHVGWIEEGGNPKVFRVNCISEIGGERIVECDDGTLIKSCVFTDHDFSPKNCNMLAVDAKDVLQIREPKDMERGPIEIEVNEEGDLHAFSDILKEMMETYIAKNHDYGNAFSEIYDELGIDYGYGKIREKVNRIKTLRCGRAKVDGEPLEDALLDCANYCILTLAELRKRKEGQQTLNHPAADVIL